jgi:hypothetical protein
MDGRRTLHVRRWPAALTGLTLLVIGMIATAGVARAAGEGGPLRARSLTPAAGALDVRAAAAADPIPLPTPAPYLRSAANGQYVSAEEQYSGEYRGLLRARAGTLGAWESFRSQALSPAGNPTCSAPVPSGWLCMGSIALQSNDSGHYVSVELGQTGATYAVLRARATQIGPWERFDRLYELASGSTGVMFALRSQANGRFVSVELDQSGSFAAVLRARATQIGPWERFRSLP